MVSIRDYDETLVTSRKWINGREDSLWGMLARHDGHHLVALADGAEKTFGDLLRDARTLARDWRRQGIRRGDIVGVQLSNSWEFLCAHAALAGIGAVTAPIHMPYSADERRAMLKLVGARGWIERRPGELSIQVTLEPDAELSRFGNSLEEALPFDGHDPFAIFFTSGTHSVEPKACLHSQTSLLQNARVVAAHAGIGTQDIIVSASPFTHLFGMLALHLGWVTGGSQVLVDHFNPQEFVSACCDYRATVAFMVPAHVKRVLSYLSEHRGIKRNWGLREVRVAGAALPSDIAIAVEDRLKARVVNHWGMSELGAGVTTHWTDDREVPSRSIGRPLAGSDVKIVSGDGKDAALGETGELWFRGPSLFYGYYRNPRATHESLARDEKGLVWFKTGDLAAWGVDGRLEYRGRMKDLVIRGGMKISAVEVESAVLEMPGVRQAALLAVPDASLGERGCLVIAVDPSTEYTLEDVCRYLEQRHMAKFKWPERLVTWDSLPLTPTGKIAKAAAGARLRRELSAVDLASMLDSGLFEPESGDEEGSSKWNKACSRKEPGGF